jgi:hypothetical protein
MIKNYKTKLFLILICFVSVIMIIYNTHIFEFFTPPKKPNFFTDSNYVGPYTYGTYQSSLSSVANDNFSSLKANDYKVTVYTGPNRTGSSKVYYPGQQAANLPAPFNNSISSIDMSTTVT